MFEITPQDKGSSWVLS